MPHGRLALNANIFLVLLHVEAGLESIPHPPNHHGRDFNFSGGITDTSGQYIDYVQVGLLDDQAPQTVANFLRYVTNHIYDNTIIHRTAPQFVVQGGGFTPVTNTTGQYTALDPVLSYGPIPNEFSPSRSYVAGMIAMAKLGSDPNSATNQWFFNVADNSTNLDAQNGGFTVFGQVLGEGMQLIDAIDGLTTYNLNQYFDPNYSVDGPTGGPFADVPLYNNTFILVTSVAVVPGPSEPTIWASAVNGNWSDAAQMDGRLAQFRRGSRPVMSPPPPP